MRGRQTVPFLAALLALGCGPFSILPLSGAVGLATATHPETLRKNGRSESHLVRKCEYRLERFHWSEYAGEEPGGGSLLDETGVTHAFGYSVLFADLDMRLSTELLIGEVDYDGQTMAGVPVATRTEYRGIEFDAMWLKELPSSYWDEFHLLVGGTMMTWSRDIKSTPVAQGYVEDWFAMGAAIGVAATRDMRAGGNVFFEALAYLPLLAQENIDLVSAEIEPDGRLSIFSDLSIGYGWDNGVSLAFRLKGLSFDRSPLADSIVGPVYQPASRMTRVGLEVAYRF